MQCANVWRKDGIENEIADVSVVIPAYNAADTIVRALMSVAEQTLPPRELLVVDDASSDDTASIIEGLAARMASPPIRLVRLSRNCGPATARNTGWDLATSRYIAFLDADDSWHRQKLEVQFGWMALNPEAVLCGHACRDEAIDIGNTTIDEDKLPVRRISPVELLVSNRFSTPTAMVRRDVEYRFEAGKKYCEDYLLWLQVVLDGHYVASIDLPLARTHKPLYGAGGLSADLWGMEKGELDVYLHLRNEGRIAWPVALLFLALSMLKYIRRRIIVMIRTSSIRRKSYRSGDG